MSALVNDIDTSLLARRSWLLRKVVRGFSKKAKTRGLPPPLLDGFGFIDVASDMSIVAGRQIGAFSLQTCWLEWYEDGDSRP